MTATDLANWDDLHVTFYSGETQILQGGDGYVMKYSGTQDGYTYFSIPIPSNAAAFSINNGKNKSGDHDQSITAKSEILPLDQTGNENLTQTFTKGGMLYTLSSDSLTKTAPTFSNAGTQQTTSSSTPYPSPRGDYIFIKDQNGTYLATAPTVTFYDSSDNVLTSPNVNTHAVDGSTKWYSVGIPTNATKFSIDNGTHKYDIYPRAASGSDNYTPGNMYYEATSASELSLLWPTFTSTGATNHTDDNWTTPAAARGDALYLVYDAKQTVTVTFKDANGDEISNGSTTSIRASYIGELTSANPGVPGESTSESNAVGHWYKVNIPVGAATFTVGDKTGDIYKLRQTPARYSSDYTLGDMQYRVESTGLKCFYPVFTEDDVYSQTVGTQTLSSSTSNVTLVDESAVSGYNTEPTEPAYTPINAANAASGDDYVLHETSTSTNNITYTWQEGTGTLTVPENNNIWFDDSNTNWGNSSHNNILVKFSNSASSASDTGNLSMSYDSTTSKYYYTVPDGNYQNVEIWKSGDTSSKVTLTNSLNSTNYYGKSCTVTVNLPTGTKLWYHYTEGEGTHNQVMAFYYKSSWTGTNTAVRKEQNGSPTSVKINNKWHYFVNFDVPDENYDRVVIHNSENTNYYLAGTFNLSSSNNYGKGIIIEKTNTTGTYPGDGNLYDYGGLTVFSTNNIKDHDPSHGQSYPIWYVINSTAVTSTYSGNLGDITGSISSPVTTQIGGTTVYSSQFQPEDRYGYISDVTSMNDSDGKHNNFVKVIDAYNNDTQHYLSDPHILFYSENGSTEINTAVSGTTQNSHGIKLNPTVVSTTYPNIDGTQYTAYGSGTAAAPYLVRLPKNAKSAQIYDGDTAVGSVVSLTDTDGKTGGVTLTVNSSSSVSVSHPDRGGTAVQASQKRTDYDYVYFTDVSNTLGSSIRAYYFGDVDGEFAQWPGVAPSYSYTDNNGDTVYAFRYPTLENTSAKSYPYVIFNNGTSYPGGMTKAVSYSGAGNYALSNTTEQYGTVSSTANNAAVIALLTPSGTQKNSTATQIFSSSNTNGKYIYYINNGTKDLTMANLAGTHTPLDDVHITFYSNETGTTAVGNGFAGYVMDKTGITDGKDVYRIAIPDGANYFSINNGAGKDTGSYLYDRSSVITKITQNGLYKFVDADTSLDTNGTKPSQLKDYWDCGDDNDVTTADEHPYYLELVNKRTIDEDEEVPPATENYDVHLATVVTKGSSNPSAGNIEKIKWLKMNGDEVDQRYLDHTTADLNKTNVTSVKVIKNGNYYWKEITAPPAYELNTTDAAFTVSGSPTTTQVTNAHSPTGSLTVSKTVEGTGAPANQEFTFTLSLTNASGFDGYTFSSGGTFTSITPDLATSPHPNEITLTLKHGESATISGIPVDTAYQVTETNPGSGWTTPK